MSRRTIKDLTYGLDDAHFLLEKLRHDAARLSREPHPYDTFNFIITAAVFQEWMIKIYRDHQLVQAVANALDTKRYEDLPQESAAWIEDMACIPNKFCDIRRHIMNALRICRDAANATKHFHWIGTSDVRDIQTAPIVTGYYQYFFTSVEPDLYFDYGGESYGLSQIKSILIQFYAGYLKHVDPQ